MSTAATFPLRLPRSVKEAAERLSKADGTSLNQFVAIAVAEKVAVLTSAAFFEERRQRSTGKALEAILSRSDGEPPREGDELPAGYVPVSGPAIRVRKPRDTKSAVVKPKGRTAGAARKKKA